MLDEQVNTEPSTGALDGWVDIGKTTNKSHNYDVCSTRNIFGNDAFGTDTKLLDLFCFGKKTK